MMADTIVACDMGSNAPPSLLSSTGMSYYLPNCSSCRWKAGFCMVAGTCVKLVPLCPFQGHPEVWWVWQQLAGQDGAGPKLQSCRMHRAPPSMLVAAKHASGFSKGITGLSRLYLKAVAIVGGD